MPALPETRKFARENADKLLDRLAFEIGRCARSRRPESVHDLRITIRRFAQVLRVFDSVISRAQTRKIRKTLKKILAAAGEVRDCDVALRLLAKSNGAGARTWKSVLQNRRKERERVLTASLKVWIDRKSSLKWRAHLQQALEPQHNVRVRPLAETVQGILRKMAADFLDRGNRLAHRKAAHGLHGFRIHVKKFRYTLELFAPLYGPSLRAWQEKIKRIQTLLGDIHDCEMARELVADTKKIWLKNRQKKKRAEFLECWAETFDGSAKVFVDALTFAPGKKPVARIAAKSVVRASAA